jgi:hypothetical protein
MAQGQRDSTLARGAASARQPSIFLGIRFLVKYATPL